jgi:hypothetical protein
VTRSSTNEVRDMTIGSTAGGTRYDDPIHRPWSVM